MNSIISSKISQKQFDFICIGVGCLLIPVSELLQPVQAWMVFLGGIALIILSLISLLSKQQNTREVKR